MYRRGAAKGGSPPPLYTKKNSATSLPPLPFTNTTPPSLHTKDNSALPYSTLHMLAGVVSHFSCCDGRAWETSTNRGKQPDEDIDAVYGASPVFNSCIYAVFVMIQVFHIQDWHPRCNLLFLIYFPLVCELPWAPGTKWLNHFLRYRKGVKKLYNLP